MWTLARDITSATRSDRDARVPWAVDPLTRTVYVRSMTDHLVPREATLLRNACAERDGHVDPNALSVEGRAIYPLLTALDADAAAAALRRLPPLLQERLTTMSPLTYLADVHAPLLVILHDRGDAVIPVGESRQLHAALAGRPGVRYTELGFRHLSPFGMAPFRLVRELAKFYRAIYPVFRCAATRSGVTVRPRLSGPGGERVGSDSTSSMLATVRQATTIGHPIARDALSPPPYGACWTSWQRGTNPGRIAREHPSHQSRLRNAVGKERRSHEPSTRGHLPNSRLAPVSMRSSDGSRRECCPSFGSPLGFIGYEAIETTNGYFISLSTWASAEQAEQAAAAAGPWARENLSFLVTLAENLVGEYLFSYTA